jgi:hypothetical protein
MTRSTWSLRKMIGIHQDLMSGLVSDEDGMFTVDGCDMPKQGSETVGVASQYCGRLGKVARHVASVVVGYAGPRWHGPINYELFLPKKWFSEEYAAHARSAASRDTSGTGRKSRSPSSCRAPSPPVGSSGAGGCADSWFGNCAEFVDFIPEGLHYFVDVHHDARFFATVPSVSTPYMCQGHTPVSTIPQSTAGTGSTVISHIIDGPTPGLWSRTFASPLKELALSGNFRYSNKVIYD